MSVALAIVAALGGAPQVELEWEAPAECPSEAALRREIERWLGDSEVEAADVRALGKVVAQADGTFALSLTIESVDGAVTQDAASPKCSALADAVALQVAMAIDPSRAAELTSFSDETLAETEPDPVVDDAEATADEPTSEPEPATEAAPPAAEPEPEPPPETGQLRGAVFLEGGVGAPRVPTIDGRLAAGASALLPSARIDLGYAHTFSQRVDHPTFSGVGLDVRQWSIVARGCWRPSWRTLEFPLCGGVEFGAVSAEGFGVEQPRRDRGAWVAALGGAALMWVPVRWIAAGIGAEAHVALTVPPVTIAEEAPLFTPGRGGGSGFVRLEARFP